MGGERGRKVKRGNSAAERTREKRVRRGRDTKLAESVMGGGGRR